MAKKINNRNGSRRFASGPLPGRTKTESPCTPGPEPGQARRGMLPAPPRGSHLSCRAAESACPPGLLSRGRLRSYTPSRAADLGTGGDRQPALDVSASSSLSAPSAPRPRPTLPSRGLSVGGGERGCASHLARNLSTRQVRSCRPGGLPAGSRRTSLPFGGRGLWYRADGMKPTELPLRGP